MSTSLDRSDLIQYGLKLFMVVTSAYVTARIAMKFADPTRDQKKSRSEIAREKLSKLNKSVKNLTEHEMVIASYLVTPDEINVSFSDIGGLEKVISGIKETVIFPISRQDLVKNSKLTRPPKGVLLHGPPGCGKTLLAKATAAQSGTSFINLELSIMTDKWYGESQKLTSAVFSLANKLSPCIIFIDEIDSFLRSRSTQDHEATAMMKAQFMTLWDGLVTDPNRTVIVMGATNRPTDLDAAILRRMPSTFQIDLPSLPQREAIFTLILKDEPVENMDFYQLASRSKGLSGSDIKEVCRIGATFRVREYIQQNPSAADGIDKAKSLLDKKEKIVEKELRCITMNDLLKAMDQFKANQVNQTDDIGDT